MWRPVQTGEAGAWSLAVAFALIICFCACWLFLARGARDPWLFLALSGSAVLLLTGAVWLVLWASRHGIFNLDVNPGAKAIRQWKTSAFLRRSFKQYACDDFYAVQSVHKSDGDGAYWVSVELLLKAPASTIQVGWFSSAYQRAESPKAAALRQELAKLMGIKDAGYFDRLQ
jgi:hypothetical protein